MNLVCVVFLGQKTKGRLDDATAKTKNQVKGRL